MNKYYYRFIDKKKHNGVGPCGVLELLCEWVSGVNEELCALGYLASKHPVPNLGSKKKGAVKYEELFLRTAVELFRLLDKQAHTLVALNVGPKYISLAIGWSGIRTNDRWTIPEWDSFMRPISKKIRNGKSVCEF